MNSKHLRVDELKGIDESYRTDPTSAELVQDMSWDTLGGWRQCGGFDTIIPDIEIQGSTQSYFKGDGIVRSLHWWSNRGGTKQYLMAEYIPEGSTLSLMVFNGSRSSMDVVESGRSHVQGAWQGTQYLAVGDWLYYINGLDAPRRWDGKRSSRVGFDRVPSAPWAVATKRKDQMASGYDDGGTRTNYNFPSARGVGPYVHLGAMNTDQQQDGEGFVYGYAITWINDLGMESEPSAIAYCRGVNKYTAITSDDEQWSERTYVKVTIPDAAPNARGIRLWRTTNLHDAQSGFSAVLYLLDEWGSGKGTIYADGTPDGELGPMLDTSNLGSFPSSTKYMAYFKGTMFVGGGHDTGDMVFYSAPGRHEQFPSMNFFKLGNKDNGQVTGFYAHENALVVFKQRGIFLIKGDPSRGFYTQTLTEDVGNVSPNVIVEVPDSGLDKWGRSSGRGLLFLSESGPYILEGALENTGRPTKPNFIGQSIYDLWRKQVNRSALIGACSVVNHQDREIWIQVPIDGGIGPTLGLVYHYDIQAWSLRKDWPMNCFTDSRDHRGHIFMGSHDTATHPGIHVYTHGYGDKNGVDLDSIYRSAWIDFGTVWQRTQVHHVRPYIMGFGANTMSFQYRGDRSPTMIAPTDSAKSQQNAEQVAQEQWGTATWGSSGYWEDYYPTPVTWTAGENYREFQWEVSATERMLIMSVDLVVRPVGSPTNIEFLDATLAPEGV